MTQLKLFHDFSFSMFSETICGNTTTVAPSTPCETFTTGGNSNGANCIFPFVYRNVSQYECITTENNGTLWCGTTGNYDTNRLWGNCAGKSKFSVHLPIFLYLPQKTDVQNRMSTIPDQRNRCNFSRNMNY